ncbi:alpha/beta fold hydrolase [Hamadaea tsunoensis]|uniref:alpha/beta fold hydrolase n=1 Tax=Hamadaea tsunoensis TaxID=53368 RepID=UPI00040B4D1E|nr:alpha/beta fold hydrolase [Hamadaea tsunoensis]
MSYHTVTSSDGTPLHVRVTGPDDAPTIVCVHGYPDDGSLWNGVTALLVPDFRVVAYDVRGAGRSGKPGATAAYQLEQLTDDLSAVIAEVGPDGPVYLLAHDWGSIQCWYAITHGVDAAGFVSISGPHLPDAARWIRRNLYWQGVRQLLKSAYIAFFRTPWLPELAIRTGLFRLVLQSDPSRRGHPPAPADARHGLALYRANMGRRLTRGATRTPTLVLAPRHDRYVGAGMQGPEAEIVEAGHWLPYSHPELVAERVRKFLTSLS